MSRELASPFLGNLVAARLSPEEFDRRTRAPLTDGELADVAALVGWFTRRYPTAKERLDYARRKMLAYTRGRGDAAPAVDYLETARRLAAAHRKADPETVAVLLDADPERREIRLVEVTRSAPTTGEPLAVGFLARPDLGVPFLSTVVLLSPEEWDAVREGRLELPYPFGVVGRLERLSEP